jgi:hypothetical protein
MLMKQVGTVYMYIYIVYIAVLYFYIFFTVEEAEAAFAMPELMYNLNLLVDMTEREIVQIDKE